MYAATSQFRWILTSRLLPKDIRVNLGRKARRAGQAFGSHQRKGFQEIRCCMALIARSQGLAWFSYLCHLHLYCAVLVVQGTPLESGNKKKQKLKKLENKKPAQLRGKTFQLGVLSRTLTS